MMQKQDMTTPKMTRVTVRVPKATLDQINNWVDTLGVRRSHFLGIALVAGARSLIQASALGTVLAPLEQESKEQASPAQEPGESASLDMIQSLQTEIAQLKSELSNLKSQVHPGRSSGRKHAS